MTIKSALAAAPVLLLALSACKPSQPARTPADAGQAAAVAAADAWCRPSPNGAKAGGCYVTLTAANDDRLTGGSTPRAGMLQVHEMKTENGMMTMSEMAQGLPLPAGEAVALAPGGAHLMLMELTAPAGRRRDRAPDRELRRRRAGDRSGQGASAGDGGHGSRRPLSPFEARA